MTTNRKTPNRSGADHGRRSGSLDVVREFRPLRENPREVLRVCVIKTQRAGRRLDIRTFIATDSYSGPTRKGVNLSAEEFDTLIEQLAEIRAALAGRDTPKPVPKPRTSPSVAALRDDQSVVDLVPSAPRAAKAAP